MGNANMDRNKKQPQAGQQPQGGRKNNEEVGEPIQLPDDMSKQGQHQPPRPGMGQREGEKHGEQHQGDQHAGQRPNTK